LAKILLCINCHFGYLKKIEKTKIRASCHIGLLFRIGLAVLMERVQDLAKKDNTAHSKSSKECIPS
jgi:hypothetical protein